MTGLAHVSRRRLTMLLAACTLATASTTARSDDFYKGKTITVYVGLAAGGTVDTIARLFAAAWERHLPGQPSLVVRNMTGGGGIVSTNYVYEVAPKDGTAIWFGPWVPLAQVLGGQGLRARYENFHFLGGIGDTRVGYARTDAIPGGIKTPADVMKATQLYVGGNAATGSAHLTGRLPLDVLGVKYKQVVGFPGGQEIFLAMQRGEIQYTATSIGTFRTRSGSFIKSGEGVGLFYLVPVERDGSFERSKFITEMPAFPDLYRQIHGKPPSGPVWDATNWFTYMVGTMNYIGFAPPGTPAPAVAALRAAFEKFKSDAIVNDAAVKHNGFPWEWVEFGNGERIIKSLADTDPKVLATFKELIETGEKAAESIQKRGEEKPGGAKQ